MLLGIAYDLRADYLAMGYSTEDAAEFDSEDTIDAICGALASLGYGIARIGNIQRLVEALANGQHWDGVFNFCEGAKGAGREAQVPALLEAYGIPYVFSDSVTMAISLDKGIAKRIVRDCGIPTPDFAVVERVAGIRNLSFPFPLFLKPVAEGSGKGIGASSKVDDLASLKRAATGLLARFGQPVLVERFLPGREFTVGIVGTGGDAKVIGVNEIAPKENWIGDAYGFENKAFSDDKVTIKPADRLYANRAGAVGLAAWRALNCRDGGRIDIRNDDAGNPNFLEANPLAGLRPDYSDLCLIASYRGIGYRELIGSIMESFLKRYPELQSRRVAA